MDEEHILFLLSQEDGIPKVFIEYTKRLFFKGMMQPGNKYLDRLASTPDATIKSIAELFRLSSKVLGLEVDEMFRALKFSPNDLDITRLESFFAELRAIKFLYNKGFSNIRVTPMIDGLKAADLCGCLNGKEYAIEVTNINNHSNNAKWRNEQFVDEIIKKLFSDGKIDQLNTTCSLYGYNEKMLITVVDAKDVIALNNRKDFYSKLHMAWEESCEDQTLSLAVVTGMSSEGELDDIIFRKK